MCGIIGFAGRVPEGCWGQTYQILNSLFRHGEVRGVDATGFVANATPLDYPQKASVAWDKQPLRATEFIKLNRRFRSLAHRRCTALVGHVRAATHGDPINNANNHPFVSDDGGLFLVHNGILTNHLDVADSLSLKLQTECDSEVLLRIVETATSVPGGLQDCLRLLKGSMAVAVYEKATGCIWLAHNGGRPLWLARLKNDRRWFFASTARILLEGIGSVARKRSLEYLAPAPEGIAMALTPDGSFIAVDSG